MEDQLQQPIQPTVIVHKENIFIRLLKFLRIVASFLGNGVKVLAYLVAMIFLLGIFTALFADTAQTGGQVLYGSGVDEIAVLNLTGTILESAVVDPLGVSDTNSITPRNVFMTLEDLKSNPNVKAVLLKINSPGGSVTASEEIYQYLIDFKDETGLPVFAYFSEVAASGGYYIAMAADQIITNEATITGSIGVISSTFNFKELADKYGVKDVTVASGDSKAFLNPLAEVDQEEISILRGMIDEAYEMFLARIIEGRSMSREELLPLADGRPLTGKQAVIAKLADGTGVFTDAVDALRQEIGATDVTVVEYGGTGFWDSLLRSFGGILRPHAFNPTELISNRLQGKPAYLYSPSASF